MFWSSYLFESSQGERVAWYIVQFTAEHHRVPQLQIIKLRSQPRYCSDVDAVVAVEIMFLSIY